MRPSAFILLPLTFSFLIFALPAKAIEPVLDVNGEEVQAGVAYYVLPLLRPGGGLALRHAREGLCPLDVVQERFDRGIPVRFTPVNPEDGIIHLSDDLNIEFIPRPTYCRQPLVWKLDRFDRKRGRNFVTTNGVKGNVGGNPGCDTLSNWFKIHKSGDNYKLVFCPTVCEFCQPSCRDIGVVVDKNGEKRLALSDYPFVVTFMKAYDDDETAKLESVV